VGGYLEYYVNKLKTETAKTSDDDGPEIFTDRTQTMGIAQNVVDNIPSMEKHLNEVKKCESVNLVFKVIPTVHVGVKHIHDNNGLLDLAMAYHYNTGKYYPGITMEIQSANIDDSDHYGDGGDDGDDGDQQSPNSQFPSTISPSSIPPIDPNLQLSYKNHISYAILNCFDWLFYRVGFLMSQLCRLDGVHVGGRKNDIFLMVREPFSDRVLRTQEFNDYFQAQERLPRCSGFNLYDQDLIKIRYGVDLGLEEECLDHDESDQFDSQNPSFDLSSNSLAYNLHRYLLTHFEPFPIISQFLNGFIFEKYLPQDFSSVPEFRSDDHNQRQFLPYQILKLFQLSTLIIKNRGEIINSFQTPVNTIKITLNHNVNIYNTHMPLYDQKSALLATNLVYSLIKIERPCDIISFYNPGRSGSLTQTNPDMIQYVENMLFMCHYLLNLPSLNYSDFCYILTDFLKRSIWCMDIDNSEQKNQNSTNNSLLLSNKIHIDNSKHPIAGLVYAEIGHFNQPQNNTSEVHVEAQMSESGLEKDQSQNSDESQDSDAENNPQNSPKQDKDGMQNEIANDQNTFESESDTLFRPNPPKLMEPSDKSLYRANEPVESIAPDFAISKNYQKILKKFINYSGLGNDPNWFSQISPSSSIIFTPTFDTFGIYSNHPHAAMNPHLFTHNVNIVPSESGFDERISNNNDSDPVSQYSLSEPKFLQNSTNANYYFESIISDPILFASHLSFSSNTIPHPFHSARVLFYWWQQLFAAIIMDDLIYLQYCKSSIESLLWGIYVNNPYNKAATPLSVIQGVYNLRGDNRGDVVANNTFFGKGFGNVGFAKKNDKKFTFFKTMIQSEQNSNKCYSPLLFAHRIGLTPQDDILPPKQGSFIGFLRNSYSGYYKFIPRHFSTNDESNNPTSHENNPAVEKIRTNSTKKTISLEEYELTRPAQTLNNNAVSIAELNQKVQFLITKLYIFVSQFVSAEKSQRLDKKTLQKNEKIKAKVNTLIIRISEQLRTTPDQLVTTVAKMFGK